MDIHYKLFKHQKELLTCTDDMVYLRAGRGSGKSFIASLIAVIALLKGQRVLIMAQDYRALTEVIMAECIQRLYEILPPDAFEVHKVSMKITYGATGVIYFSSYSNMDSVRGFSKIQLSILDEVCLAPPNLYEVLAYCQRNLEEPPRIIMCSTPRPANWVTAFIKDRNVRVISARTSDNKLIKPEEIALMKKTCLSEEQWLREFEGVECEDNNSGILFTDELLENAPNSGTCLAIGVDCAGYGKDCNCIVVRKGNSIVKVIRKTIASAKDLFADIKMIIHEYGASNFSHIAIDMAYGQGLYELLMDSEYKTFTYLIPFGGAAEDPAYLNKRAEMYVAAKRYISEHGISGIDDQMKEELKSTRYELSPHDKVQLIKKEDIRLILKRSPDSADAFALTFSMTDMPRGIIMERKARQSVYMD
jgi:hypothetical protein